MRLLTGKSDQCHNLGCTEPAKKQEKTKNPYDMIVRSGRTRMRLAE
jgi:hypothetical protein